MVPALLLRFLLALLDLGLATAADTGASASDGLACEDTLRLATVTYHTNGHRSKKNSRKKVNKAQGELPR